VGGGSVPTAAGSAGGAGGSGGWSGVLVAQAIASATVNSAAMAVATLRQWMR